MRRNRNTNGFVLPLAMLLIVMLAISGASFLQHDFLERRMTTTEFDNHQAFYLAHAGLERGRESYKFDVFNNHANWDVVLQNSNGKYKQDTTPFCFNAANPDSCICPPDLARGCAMPQYGASATLGDLGIGGDLFPGVPAGFVSYEVRAFNNDEESIGFDQDGKIMIRALGTVRDEQKMLEIEVLGQWLGVVNCEGNVLGDCPNEQSSQMQVRYLSGHQPRQIPSAAFPRLSKPLSDPTNYYRQVSNFTVLHPAFHDCSPPPGMAITLTTQPTRPNEVLLQDACFYFSDKDITVARSTGQTTDNIAKAVVIYSLGKVTLGQHMQLRDSIIIGGQQVDIKFQQSQGSFLNALPPRPFPAIISGGSITGGDNALIRGTVFASTVADTNNPLPDPTDQGEIDLSGPEIHGVIFGRTVKLQGSGIVTDDRQRDYYDQMPGFDPYSPNIKATSVLHGSWREVQ